MTLSRKELTEKILVFAKKVAEQITAYKNNEKAYKGSFVYIKKFCENFKNEGGNITYKTNFKKKNFGTGKSIISIMIF